MYQSRLQIYYHEQGARERDSKTSKTSARERAITQAGTNFERVGFHEE